MSGGLGTGVARGGHRQKRQWVESAPASSQMAARKSSLARLLVDKWAWGHFSAPLVQQVAQAAEEDGNTCVEIRKLAAMGSRGLYPGNCHADLERHLRPTPVTTALRSFSATIAKPPCGFWTGSHTILLPHELFATIFTHHSDVFYKSVCGGGVSNVELFWSNMQGHPAYRDHPVRLRTEHLSKAIPLSLHGDGVPVSGVGKSWSQSVDVYSWASMLSKGRTTDTMYLIYLLNPKLCVKLPGKNVQDSFFTLLKWSFYWLFVGKWPLRDHEEKPYPPGSPEADKAGTPLAGVFFGTLWCLKGDLDHMTKVYRLPRWDSLSPCALCGANKSDKPWTDGRPTAAWRSTIFTNSEWHSQHQEHHCIFDVPGMGIQAFVPDIMHTLHLGVYQQVLGSTLQLLVAHMLPRTPEQNMEHVWGMVKEYYKEPPVSGAA